MPLRYVADLHLFDQYSLDWRSHLNTTLYGFSELLIERWNNCVSRDDTIIIAGDVGYCCEATFSTLRKLKGTKVLVIGNHDVCWGKHLFDCNLFMGTHQTIERNGICIQHTPDFDAEIRQRNNYLIHGHHHEYDSVSMRRELLKYINDECRYNCAVDLINYAPRTLSELITYKEKLIDKYSEIITM